MCSCLNRVETNHFFLFCLALSNFESFLLSDKTLNLSKSVRFCLLACLAYDFPNGLSAKVLATFYLAINLVNFPVLTPLPIFSTCLVSCNLLTGMSCLWMFSPSTKTLLSLRMSTIVTNRPSNGPKLTLATLPT